MAFKQWPNTAIIRRIRRRGKSGLICRGKSALLFAAIACAFAGCGGKDAVAPIEVKKQAFEDLRSEIREVIDDPAREAEAITLVDALAEDLNTLRE